MNKEQMFEALKYAYRALDEYGRHNQRPCNPQGQDACTCGYVTALKRVGAMLSEFRTSDRP